MLEVPRYSLCDGTAPAGLLSVNLCLNATKTRLDVNVRFERKANRKACAYWLRKKLEESCPKDGRITFDEDMMAPEFKAVVTLC